MADDQVLAAWRTLREQFLDGANRHPKLIYRLVELSGQSRSEQALPASDPGWRLVSQAGLAVEYSIPASNPQASSDGRATPMLPGGDHWRAFFFTDGDQCLEAYRGLAEAAGKLFACRPMPVPVPEADLARVTEHFPGVTDILPRCLDPYLTFAHVVNWIARSGDHLILTAEARTWNGSTIYPAKPEEFRRLAIECAGISAAFGSPSIDRDLSAERRFTDLPDLFMASAWAIDWITAKVAAEDQPASPAKVNRVSGKKADASTNTNLDDRACALFQRYISDGQNPSMTNMALELGVVRQTLYKCDRLMRLRESYNRSPHRGTKVKTTRLVEAWDDEDD